jgi:hypothetical protein
LCWWKQLRTSEFIRIEVVWREDVPVFRFAALHWQPMKHAEIRWNPELQEWFCGMRAASLVRLPPSRGQHRLLPLQKWHR